MSVNISRTLDAIILPKRSPFEHNGGSIKSVFACHVKLMTVTPRRVFISYVYASLLSVVTDECERINVPQKEGIKAGRGADC